MYSDVNSCSFWSENMISNAKEVPLDIYPHKRTTEGVCVNGKAISCSALLLALRLHGHVRVMRRRCDYHCHAYSPVAVRGEAPAASEEPAESSSACFVPVTRPAMATREDIHGQTMKSIPNMWWFDHYGALCSLFSSGSAPRDLNPK